ncbi:MAG: dihydrofolate reductase-like domain-containing protein [Monoraphidium minutum]|nr:MAG: dihydrofolate reductase-like domain-containing protein [Monoraphidium minutum]
MAGPRSPGRSFAECLTGESCRRVACPRRRASKEVAVTSRKLMVALMGGLMGWRALGLLRCAGAKRHGRRRARPPATGIQSRRGGVGHGARGVGHGRAVLRAVFRAQAATGWGTPLSDADLRHLVEAAELAGASAGLTQPHPNAACVLVAPDGRTVASAFQRAHGSAPAEALAVAAAGPAAAGATAYLNLESGDCHGDDAAIAALVAARVGRVVVGLRHPLRHLRNRAVGALRRAGVRTDVLGEGAAAPPAAAAAAGAADAFGAAALQEPSQAALMACLRANEGLLHRAVLRRPMSVLKYAMTLDGKIATARVFEMRARSDAVIVGGNTVRRDNPNLTTRRRARGRGFGRGAGGGAGAREGGFAPWRIVMSRSLDLPEEANLWDVSSAPTIVMTQRGARQGFQKMLRAKGVEVVEFDFLTPENVAEYCYERGFLQVFWECGGTLSAPAISGGVVHKVMAFVAPKIIGGDRAPCPVGELGFVEMTQAVNLIDTEYLPSGPDLLVTGYLPASGGLLALEQALSYPEHKPGVEHYYQAAKFGGVSGAARALASSIRAAQSPEEAARIGRRAERSQPELVRADWGAAKRGVMMRALRAKFTQHEGPRRMLLSTAAGAGGEPAARLVEASPNDHFWGQGFSGSGRNLLGSLLMELREELLAAEGGAAGGGGQQEAAAVGAPA